MTTSTLQTPQEMAEATLGALKSLLALAVAPMQAEIRELRAKLEALPIPKDGEPGAPGAQGPVGEKGADCDMAAVSAVLGELVTKAVAEIPPPKDGKDGAPGKDGASVDVDAIERDIGERFAKAVSQLRDGRDGQQGKQGEPGRDAIHISISPTIDEKLSYPRGSYATHKGGLWRSVKTTDGMDGWECIVNGVDSVTQERTGEREITVTTTLADGTKSVLAYEFRTVRHRGLYEQGKTYDEGDTVTRAGSLWIATEDGITDPPADVPTSKWALAAKKGGEGASAWHVARKHGGYTGSEYDFGKMLADKARK